MSIERAKLKTFLGRHGYSLKERNIRRVVYTHKTGPAKTAEVGRAIEIDGERQPVIAIFETVSGAILICTPTRGGDYHHVPIHTGNEGDDTIVSIEDDEP
jgi:hypothetical protein